MQHTTHNNLMQSKNQEKNLTSPFMITSNDCDDYNKQSSIIHTSLN